MHLKRQKIPKKWPIERKGTAFIVRPTFAIYRGLPILIALRDVLKLAQNRKEVKRAIHLKEILLNCKPVTDERNNILLFDTLGIISLKKFYRLQLSETGKFILAEIEEKESQKKISKIINKKILKSKKIQLNLIDGKNFISDIKCNINDSVVLNFVDKKIEKCLPLKEKSKATVFAGKHSGQTGTIEKIEYEKKMAELNIEKKKIHVLIKQLMVLE